MDEVKRKFAMYETQFKLESNEACYDYYKKELLATGAEVTVSALCVSPIVGIYNMTYFVKNAKECIKLRRKIKKLKTELEELEKTQQE